MNNRRRGWFKKSNVASIGFLGDEYALTWGVSFRKLRSAYSGACCRIRKASDGTEQDFGFVSNYVDVAGIESWLAGSEGRIKIFYDQIGSPKINFVQTNNTAAPIIAPSGVVTKNSDGDVYIDANGSSTWMVTAPESGSSQPLDPNNAAYSWHGVFSDGVDGRLNRGQNTSTWSAILVAPIGTVTNSTLLVVVGTSNTIINNVTGTFPAKRIISGVWVGASIQRAVLNGVNNITNFVPNASMRTATDPLYLGYYGGTTSGRASRLIESVISKTDVNANLNLINTRINDYYNCF